MCSASAVVTVFTDPYVIGKWLNVYHYLSTVIIIIIIIIINIIIIIIININIIIIIMIEKKRLINSNFNKLF